MSIRIMTLAWAVDLPPSEKLVLLALADCANDEGHCWPGRSSLIAKTGQCLRTLQDALRSLDKKGHITRDENPGRGVNYTVHPVAKSATGGKSCTGGKNCHTGVAKSAPKPSRTVSRKKDKPSSNARASFPAPIGVSDEQWSAFKKQRKKPLNERSYLLLSNKLAALAEDGWPPGDMIDLAIERGWETVFAPRDRQHGRPHTLGRDQSADGLSSTARAAIAVFGR